MIPIIGWSPLSWIGDFVVDNFRKILLLIDSVLYLLLNMVYEIFLAVARIDIFGGTTEGLTIYNEFTKRMYMIISVIMVFVFAYQMILVVINPDGDGAKSTSDMVKKLIISVIFIALFPTIFRWMSLFQDHVLTNNTIPAIILGINPSKDDGEPGKNIGLMIFTTFYHPNGTNYSTFIDNTGKIRNWADVEPECIDDSKDIHSSEDVCEAYYDGLKDWVLLGDTSVVGNKTVRKAIGEEDGSEYLVIISAAASVVAIIFFLSYSIDIGVRAVKLGVLQIIAPIPMMMYVFPQAKKTFDAWKGELIKTYVELFIRVGVVFFCIYVIQLLPAILKAVFNSSSSGNTLLTAIAMVLLIFGILKFAKDAPELFKTIFASSGNWFAGMNFKPGVKSRIEGNEYGMKAIGMGAGIAGGVKGAFKQRYSRARQKDGRIFSAAKAAFGLPRGIISGAVQGVKQAPQKLNKDALKDTYYGSADVVKRKEEKFHQSVDTFKDDFRKAKDAASNYLATKPPGVGYGTAGLTFIGTALGSRGKKSVEWAKDEWANFWAGHERRNNYWNSAPELIDEHARENLNKVQSISNGFSALNKFFGDKEKKIKETAESEIQALRNNGITVREPDKNPDGTIKKDANGNTIYRDVTYKIDSVEGKRRIDARIEAIKKNRDSEILKMRKDELEKDDLRRKEYQQSLSQIFSNYFQTIGGIDNKEIRNKIEDSLNDKLKAHGFNDAASYVENMTKKETFDLNDMKTMEDIVKLMDGINKTLSYSQDISKTIKPVTPASNSGKDSSSGGK